MYNSITVFVRSFRERILNRKEPAMPNRNPNGRLVVVQRIKVGKTIKWQRTFSNGEIKIYRTKKAALADPDHQAIITDWIAEGPWRGNNA